MTALLSKGPALDPKKRKPRLYAKNDPRENMNKFIPSFFITVRALGLDLKKLKNALFGTRAFLADLSELKRQWKRSSEFFAHGVLYPCFEDRFQSSGVASGHYFHQDIYVARKVYERKPLRHIDVGSRVDGFISHLAVFREVEVLDVRALDSNVKNIKFTQADLMLEHTGLEECCDSLSCLHALEHFGLGRYGDGIDFDGHLKGLASITKLLKKGGRFYLSAPIGPQRIEFNAHRVFSVEYLINKLKDSYSINEFSYVDDLGHFHENIDLDEKDVTENFGCKFGCGIFDLKKL